MARHSFATNNLVRGVSVKAIQDRLGHSCLSTTMLYLHDDFKPDQLLNYTEGLTSEIKPETPLSVNISDNSMVPESAPEIKKRKKLTKYAFVAGQIQEAEATIQEAKETVKIQRSLIDLVDRKRA
jgi:hypothetical protein